MKRLVLVALFGGGLAAGFAAGCSSATCPGSSGSGSCFTVSGSGSTQTCTYNSGNASSCSAGQTSGHCPSSSLVGCCVTTETALGCTETAADCYYSSTEASTAMSACTGGVAGTTLKWVTSPP